MKPSFALPALLAFSSLTTISCSTVHASGAYTRDISPEIARAQYELGHNKRVRVETEGYDPGFSRLDAERSLKRFGWIAGHEGMGFDKRDKPYTLMIDYNKPDVVFGDHGMFQRDCMRPFSVRGRVFYEHDWTCDSIGGRRGYERITWTLVNPKGVTVWRDTWDSRFEFGVMAQKPQDLLSRRLTNFVYKAE